MGLKVLAYLIPSVLNSHTHTEDRVADHTSSSWSCRSSSPLWRAKCVHEHLRILAKLMLNARKAQASNPLMNVISIGDILNSTESELIDLATMVPVAGVEGGKDHSPISPQSELDSKRIHLRPDLCIVKLI